MSALEHFGGTGRCRIFRSPTLSGSQIRCSDSVLFSEAWAYRYAYHSPPGTTWDPHGNRREPAETDMSVRNRKRVTREQPQCDRGVTTQIVVTQKLSWASKVAFTKYRSETWNRRSQESGHHGKVQNNTDEIAAKKKSYLDAGTIDMLTFEI